jgi:hypothetical protein
VQTNEETVRQLTERMGACMEAVQTADDLHPFLWRGRIWRLPHRLFKLNGTQIL